jgi:uncharacterized membrane protein YbhN (UPF0104 family)
MFLNKSKVSEAEARPAESRPAPGPRHPVLAWLWRHHHAIVGLVLLGVAALAIAQIAERFDFDEVIAHLRGLPWQTVVQAVLLSIVGYLVLTGYDLSALIYLKLRVPYRTVAFASFAGYAISNNVGWAVISGGSVRYRVYSAAGLSAGDIARVVVFSTTTFTLGVTATGGLSLLLGPQSAAMLLGVPPWIVQAVAGLTLAGLAGLTVLVAVTHRPIRIGTWTFSLPSSGIVLAQIVIAVLELMLSAGALYLLMPSHGIGYAEFLGIYTAALILGIISHVPGGIGVFETVLLLGLSERGSASGVLAALLAYRALYYVLPLLIAGFMMALWEWRAQRRRRAARAKGPGPAPPGPAPR